MARNVGGSPSMIREGADAPGQAGPTPYKQNKVSKKRRPKPKQKGIM